MIYTLGQFTRPAYETSSIPPEEKLLKRYIDSRKKEYLEFVKQNERSYQSVSIEFKQTASRVTIEGEHVCLLMVKKVVNGGGKTSAEDNYIQASAKGTVFEIEITPILNAPY